MKGAVWDLTKLAKACGTTVAAKDWPFIISRMMPHNKPGLCAKFGTPGAHCDDTSAAHVCATFDYDVMIETCARYATATEKALLAKQATDAGADGKGKGGGRGKGAGKGAGGRGGGRRGGRGGAPAHDSSEAGGGQPSYSRREPSGSSRRCLRSHSSFLLVSLRLVAAPHHVGPRRGRPAAHGAPRSDRWHAAGPARPAAAPTR
jgi:hypothetical protein